MRLVHSVDDARARLLGRLRPLTPRFEPLRSAGGQTLAESIVAPVDLPKFTNTAMDGFAIRSDDTALASTSNPIHLRIAGSLEAGSAWPIRLDESTCLRVSTGAAIPDACDTVVPFEDTRELHGAIEIRSPVPPGRHVRPQGEDIRRGSVALSQGTSLRPQELGLLAALGIDSVPVIPSPVVAVLSIGPELLESATPEIVGDANGPMLSALAEAAGADVRRTVQSDGDPAYLRTLLEELAETTNLIIASGGISNSPADTLSGIIEASSDGELWNLRLRPGKHFGVASVRDTTLLALPGNPVAAFVGFQLLGRSAIDHLAGRPPELLLAATLTASVPGTSERLDAIRARAWIDSAGRVVVTPTENRGSGIVSSLTEANCLLLLPESTAAAEAGDIVSIQWIRYQ